jgi:hypothetical protein
MTSPSNTWSTDKPHNLRLTLARKNSADPNKLKSPIAAGSILKPIKITPGSETRAASASPGRSKQTTTASETKKANDKKTKELELVRANSASTLTEDENQTKKKANNTDRIVIITDPTAAKAEVTKDIIRDHKKGTEVETKHTKEIKDKKDEEVETEEEEIEATQTTEITEQEEAEQEETIRKKEPKDNEQEEVNVEIEEEEEETDTEEEEDEETQARNLDELFDGPLLTVLKDGQPLPPPTIYRVISTPEKGLIGKNVRIIAPRPPIGKESKKATTSCREITKERKKGQSTNRQEEEEDMADRGLIPQNFTGIEDAEHWLQTVELWLTFRDFTGEKALAAVKLLLKGGA